jgi:hypothetical protein
MSLTSTIEGRIGEVGAFAGVARVHVEHAVEPLERAGDGVGAVVAGHAGNGQVSLRQRRAVAQVFHHVDHLLR